MLHTAYYHADPNNEREHTVWPNDVKAFPDVDVSDERGKKLLDAYATKTIYKNRIDSCWEEIFAADDRGWCHKADYYRCELKVLEAKEKGVETAIDYLENGTPLPSRYSVSGCKSDNGNRNGFLMLCLGVFVLVMFCWMGV